MVVAGSRMWTLRGREACPRRACAFPRRRHKLGLGSAPVLASKHRRLRRSPLVFVVPTRRGPRKVGQWLARHSLRSSLQTESEVGGRGRVKLVTVRGFVVLDCELCDQRKSTTRRQARRPGRDAIGAWLVGHNGIEKLASRGCSTRASPQPTPATPSRWSPTVPEAPPCHSGELAGSEAETHRSLAPAARQRSRQLSAPAAKGTHVGHRGRLPL
jgi:hypothetical protein